MNCPADPKGALATPTLQGCQGPLKTTQAPGGDVASIGGQRRAVLEEACG